MYICYNKHINVVITMTATHKVGSASPPSSISDIPAKPKPNINNIEDVTAIRTEDRTTLHMPPPTRTELLWRPVQDYFGKEPLGKEHYEVTGEKENAFANKELIVLNPSLFRRISDLFWTVVHDMWMSAGGLLGAILPGCLKFHISADCATHLENPNLKQLSEGSQIYSAVERLNTQKQANSSIVHEYCAYLEKAYPNSAQYIPHFVQKCAANRELPKRKDGCDKLLIPIVLKGFPCEHIVALCISYDEDGDATLEFYDSKGLTIADRFDQRLANEPDMTLGKLIAILTSQYCPDLRASSKIHVKENTKKHQWDSHNCGIYVSSFFEKRLMGASPEMIYDLESSYKKTATMRQEMIPNLLPRLWDEAAANAMQEPDIPYPEDEADKEIQKVLGPPLEHPILDEVAGFKEGVMVLSEAEDEASKASKKPSIKSPYRQIGEGLEPSPLEAYIYTDLEDVPLS